MLLDAGFIKEVYHPYWFANLVFVPKRIKIGGYLLIILISTVPTKKICLACLELIKLWTPRVTP
jgi:hypothetical protein